MFRTVTGGCVHMMTVLAEHRKIPPESFIGVLLDLLEYVPPPAFACPVRTS